jgi:hypothetical protein
VLEVLAIKFYQCEKFQKYLLSTNKRLLIHNVADNFWGSGWNGKGKNIQGRLIMQFRGQKAIPTSTSTNVTTHASVTTPAPVPTPVTLLASVTTPAPVPTPVTLLASVTTPAPVPTPVTLLASVTTPAPVPTPVTLLASVTTPAPVPTPVTLLASVTTPAPVSTPVTLGIVHVTSIETQFNFLFANVHFFLLVLLIINKLALKCYL